MATYPDGALLKASGPEIDQMKAGQSRWIPDPDTFNALGYNWNAIKHIADADLTAIPEGAPLPSKVQQPTATDTTSQLLAQMTQQQDQLSQQITALTQQMQQLQLQAQQPMSADKAQ